jgi:hypothetical protein
MKNEIIKELDDINDCKFLSCLLKLIKKYKKKSGF